MSEIVELVTGRGERAQEVRRRLDVPFDGARDVCVERIGAEGIEIHVVDAPDECIPELGLGGYTFGPRSIVLAVDPDKLLRESDVYSTLAQAFEHECTGRVPIYAQGGVSPEHRALALAALGEDPATEGRWFFGAADLPRWFGYRLGYVIVKDWLESQDRDAADAVHEPAESFLHDLRG
jgi:hypothetical protein